MSFVSIAFLALFVGTLVVYHLCHRSTVVQNLTVLAASLIFYGWWSVTFLLVLIAFTLANFVAGIAIERWRGWARVVLAGAIAANLAFLGYFKYANFFIDGFAVAAQSIGFQPSTVILDLVLPLGISFFVFQKIAYVVDVYRGAIKAERSVLDFLCFVLFFPQLVAGPIERADHLLPQFKRPRTLTEQDIQQGVFLICWGLVLKIAVADSLAHLVDNTFRVDQRFGWSVILGTVAFGFQIYGDFCGYSMMAKGFAKLLGFDLTWNFQQPYFSRDIREFWQRWHISLGRWLRDYLYIPLGGNRGSVARTQMNLLTTMALGGLWHGAAWTFVAWGLLHGLALSVERAWPERLRLPSALSWALTMAVVFTGWFLFRAQSTEMLLALTDAVASDLKWRPGHTYSLTMILALAVPVMIMEAVQIRNGFFALIDERPIVAGIVNASCLILTLALIENVRSQFVYFQF